MGVERETGEPGSVAGEHGGAGAEGDSPEPGLLEQCGGAGHDGPVTLEGPLRVGELARRTGKTVRALHLYEEMSLLKPVHRSKGGFRLYAPSAVKRVEWIGKLQDAGFSLHELQQLLAGVNESGVASLAMSKVREIFQERLRDTREQIRRLTQLEQDLVASLGYLEGCRSCEPEKHQIQECPSCNHNGHSEGQQPILVAGIHRG